VPHFGANDFLFLHRAIVYEPGRLNRTARPDRAARGPISSCFRREAA
jgi:hypothetical protein